MSKTRRLKKEIDYLKRLIGIFVALSAGLTTWFVHTKEHTNTPFKIIAITMFLFFICGIIYSHKKIKNMLDALEEEDDK